MAAQKQERNTFELKATAAVFMTCCGDGGIALLMNLAAHNDGFHNKFCTSDLMDMVPFTVTSIADNGM